jgi:hypothetical protein
VGVGAAQHGEVERAGDVEVIGELGLTGEERRVFAAPQRCADDLGGLFDHGHAGTPCAAAKTDLTMLW